jgi:hypothetical protein
LAEGANVNAYVNRINQAEQGRIFVDRAGVLVMQPRIGTTLDAPTATFNDTGTAIPYDGVGVEYDQQLIINTATIEIESGGTPQVATDAASIAEYFVQALAITDSLLQNDAEALTLADYLLEGIPTPRFTSISTTFASLTTLQKGHACTDRHWSNRANYQDLYNWYADKQNTGFGSRGR